MQQSNALLDEEAGNVVCQECGDPIDNISEAMKRTLKSFGQIVRSEQRKAFMLACKSCHANREVVLNQDNETICKQCHQPLTIHPAFKLAMEAAGTKFEKIDTTKKKVSKKTTKKKATRKKVSRKTQA